MTARGKAKPTLVEHVRKFSVSVRLFKLDRSEENVGNLEKNLQVLNQVTDLSDFDPIDSTDGACLQFLLDLQWILESQDHKSNSVWTAVNLLTRLSKQNSSTRRFLRDRLVLQATLTNLLVTLPETKHVRTTKLLDLLCFMAYGIEFTRGEAYVSRLFQVLLRYISSKSDDLIARSFFILTAMCRNNSKVTNLLFSHLSEKERKSFFASEYEDIRAQVLVHHLNYCLSRANLSSSLVIDHECAEGYIAKISDAFCAAYAEDECLQLQIFADFVEDLGRDRNYRPIIENGINVATLQQVLLIADFSDASNLRCNGLLFSFLRGLIGLHPDPVSCFDVVAKSLLLRLEAVQPLLASEAVNVFLVILDRLAESDPNDSTAMQNFKLQIDQLLPAFCDLLNPSNCKRALKPEELRTVEVVLRTLDSICQFPAFRDLVPIRLKPKYLLDLTSTILLHHQNLRSLKPRLDVLVAAFRLAKRLASEGKTWTGCYADLSERHDVRDCLRYVLRPTGGDSVSPQEVQSVLNLVADHPKLAEHVKVEDKENAPPSFRTPSKPVLKANDIKRIENVLENVTKSVENMKVDNVSEVLELNNYRLLSQRHHMEALQEDLEAADNRIKKQNVHICHLETETAKQSALLQQTFEKLQMSKEELDDIRRQYETEQKSSNKIREELKEECQAKEKIISDLEKESEKLTAKASKYKGLIETLQEAVKENQQVQAELEEKLKEQSKLNTEMTIIMQKREEKMKKKERQLEDEIMEREKVEKEMEGFRKECASLQTLNKRLEQALAKKEKLLQEQAEEVAECKRIQDAIFNLSKSRPK